MKVILAALVALVVGAGGAQALTSAPNPEVQIARLQAEVTALQQFDRHCVLGHLIDLHQDPNSGAMVWGVGLPTTHSGQFFGIPGNASPAPCLRLP
jgi:hypothetical protein